MYLCTVASDFAAVTLHMNALLYMEYFDPYNECSTHALVNSYAGTRAVV